MKTKLQLTLFILICISFNSFTQVPGWVWAKNMGGTDNEYSYGIACNSYGEKFVTGMFYNDTIIFDTITLLGPGVFLTKFDSSGNAIWAKRGNLGPIGETKGVACDAFGNVFITGNFFNTAIFDSDTITGTGIDIFIVKYDSNGNLLWAKSAGGSSQGDESNSITTDNSGNFYLTGSFSSDTIFFGAISLLNSNNNNYSDAFIVKYDNSGNAIWAGKIGGTDNDYGNSISVDLNKNVFITGNYYSSSITFAGSTLTNASGGNDKFFIAKFDSSGNALWADGSSGSPDQNQGFGIVTDTYGNAYATGHFSGMTIVFGNNTITAGGYFTVKYNSAGVVEWAKGVSLGGGEGRAIAADNSGGIFVVGDFNPGITIGNITLTSYGASDIFIVKYDSAGIVKWAKSAGGSGGEIPEGICLDANDNIYTTGSFYSPSINFGTINLISNGSGDIFIAELGQLTTGEDEIKIAESDLIIFPNPSHGKFNIEWRPEMKDAMINVYNLLGENIFNEYVSNNNPDNYKYINLNVSSGVYFIEVFDGVKYYNKKIIVE